MLLRKGERQIEPLLPSAMGDNAADGIRTHAILAGSSALKAGALGHCATAAHLSILLGAIIDKPHIMLVAITS